MNHKKWIRALKTLRFILKIVVFIIVIYLIGSMIFSYEIIDIGFPYDNLIFFFILVGIYALIEAEIEFKEDCERGYKNLRRNWRRY